MRGHEKRNKKSPWRGVYLARCPHPVPVAPDFGAAPVFGLCGQVLNERREKKQALDSYLAEFAKVSYDAIRQGDGYADAIDYDKLVDGCPTAIGVTDAEVTLERGNGFGLTVSYTLKIPVSWNGRTFGTLSVPMRVSSFYEKKEV